MCISFDVMFSLSEGFAGMGKPRYSKSLLILCAYPCAVAVLELQSNIKFSMKQATSLSYPSSSPQGSGTIFACTNLDTELAETVLFQLQNLA